MAGFVRLRGSRGLASNSMRVRSLASAPRVRLEQHPSPCGSWKGRQPLAGEGGLGSGTSRGGGGHNSTTMGSSLVVSCQSPGRGTSLGGVSDTLFPTLQSHKREGRVGKRPEGPAPLHSPSQRPQRGGGAGKLVAAKTLPVHLLATRGGRQKTR